MNGVSVIVCCYNGVRKLPDTLACLANQVTDIHLHYEVVFIDNASTDQTAAIASDYWLSLNSPIPFTILSEPRPGKNYAIETGIQAATFDIILFCDDDNLLNPRYLQTGFDYFQQQPQLGLLGGMGVPKFNTDRIPDWFERYAYQYALGAQATGTIDITEESGFVYGAGSFLRKSAYLALKERGFQYTLSGKINNQILPGEDNELGYALSLLGYAIHYHEKLIFTHVISAERLTWKYIKRLKRNVAYSSAVLIPYKEVRKNRFSNQAFSFSWNKHLLQQLRYLSTNLIRYPFASRLFKQDILLDIQARLGTMSALFRHRRYLMHRDKWLPFI